MPARRAGSRPASRAGRARRRSSGAVRFGPRTVNAGRAAGASCAFETSRPSADPVAVAAVEDPDRFEAVGPQAPPGPRGEQALGVVVDDDRRAIGDARPGPPASAHPVRPGEEDRLAVLAVLDEVGRASRQRRAGDVAGWRGPPARCRRAASGGPGPGSRNGRDSRRAIPWWRGAPGGPGHSSSVSYGRGRPFLPDPEKLAAVRDGLPSLAAGIYLNTGSVGPLPAETAAAMADMADVRARCRARARRLLRRVARPDGRGAGRRGGGARRRTSAPSRLTHVDDRRDERRDLLPDWRHGGRIVTTTHEHAGGLGPLYALRERYGVELAFVDAGADGDDERTLAAFDAAITPGTRLVSLSHVAVDDRRGHAGRGDRRAGPRPRRARRRRRRPGRRRDPVPFESWARTSMPCRPRSGCSGRRGWARSSSIRARSSGSARRSAAGSPSSEANSAGRARWWPDGRRFEATGFHRPSVVGMARSIGWLSMFVGPRVRLPARDGDGRGGRGAPRGDPGCQRPDAAPRDGDAGDVPDRRLAGRGGARRAGGRGSSRSRGPSEPLDAIRISVGFFTTDDELERFAEAVELLAGSTPETLPPRRVLTILGEG